MSRTIAAATMVALAGLAANASETNGRDGVTNAPEHFRGCGKSHVMRQLADAGLNPMGGSNYPVSIAARSALDDTDVLHVGLDLEADFDNRSLAGACRTTVRVEVDGMTEYTFRLADNFAIGAISIDGVAIPEGAGGWQTVSATTKTVTLPTPMNTGDIFVIDVDYSGQTISGFFGSIEWITPDSPHAGGWITTVDMVYTLSQPYYSYTWWPCEDGDLGEPGDFTDKFLLDMSVTAPSQYSTAGIGELVGVDLLPGDRKRYRYSHDYQIPTYLVAFATSEYQKETRTWNYDDISMPVEVMITNQYDSPQARDDWFIMIDMLTEFSDRFGVYPFNTEKYGMYEFGFGGGMEHQSNTGQLAHPCCTALDWLTAHELAHQWYGDWVTCATWHDIWLNEGFASYSEAIWEEVKFGPAGLQAYMTDPNANFPSDVDDSVYVYDTTDPNRIFEFDYTYLKGSWVVHMLRGVLGDDAFYQVLNDYVSWFGGSGATTNDFKNAAEASSGMELDRFFDQWVFQTGAPDYTYGWRVDTVGGQDYLRVHLRQTQDAADAGGSAFEMPVGVRVDGTDDYTVANDEYDEHFVVPIPSGAAAVALDPDSWILKRADATEEAYTDGPPVVVATAVNGASIDITFVEPVTLAELDLVVVTADPLGTPTAFVLTYDGLTNTATLDLGAADSGDYAITVRDTVVSVAAGLALDGEGQDLPSGDGLPGGDFSMLASIVNDCPADVNGDGIVDNGDIGAFIALFVAGDLGADFNGDGIVDNGDIGTFIALFTAGC